MRDSCGTVGPCLERFRRLQAVAIPHVQAKSRIGKRGISRWQGDDHIRRVAAVARPPNANAAGRAIRETPRGSRRCVARCSKAKRGRHRSLNRAAITIACPEEEIERLWRSFRSGVCRRGGGIDGGSGIYFANAGEDVHAVGSLAPAFPAVGCIVIIRPGGRQGARPCRRPTRWQGRSRRAGRLGS